MRFISLIVMAFLMMGAQGFAADVPPPVPVTAVSAEALPLPEPVKATPAPTPPEMKEDRTSTAAPIAAKSLSFEFTPKGERADGYVVMELFTTQACTFCPKADAIMADFVDQDDIIALSCHVDYFDVKSGSLALPICSTRQKEYEGILNAGPKYTPQVLFNGSFDSVGYLYGKMNESFERAKAARIPKIDLSPIGAQKFQAVLPQLAAGDYKIWLMTYDEPRMITVADGANRGKDVTYYNTVSGAGFLGDWSGAVKVLRLDPKLPDTAKGFALLVQDSQYNIVLAAKYEG